MAIMAQQATQVTAIVVHDPVTSFFGAIQRFWHAQDIYAFLIGTAIGISFLLIFIIFRIFKKP